ncbi:MAG: hypothetical protein N3D10_01365, partial [Candidatus Micrarchaeota archaeon]|nr:hypothetical protein [Candidatus Micrarchaeota archaeon]
TPYNFFTLYYYHPYYSSQNYVEFSLSQTKIEVDVTLPIELASARLNFAENKKGISDAVFWFVRPFIFYKKTDNSGNIFLKLPKGSFVQGWIDYKNSSMPFNFSLNESIAINFSYPFIFNSTSKISENFFNLTKIQISRADKKAYSYKPVIVSSNSINTTYLTDFTGTIYVLSSPTSNLDIFYLHADQALEDKINISNNSNFKLFIPTILQFSQPQITYLGESCYNVRIKIKEPRKGVIEKVYAKSIESNDSYILTLEQNQLINESELVFYKIFCVVNDTYFDIIAQSPYETASVKIELVKPPSSPSPPQQVQEEIPPFLKERLKQAQKMETIILLLELLVILIIAYLFLRFKSTVYFVVQSIIRFFYFYLKKKK